MHLPKKTKTILAWTIPSAVLIAGASISVPFVVISENNKYDTLNRAPDFQPVLNKENGKVNLISDYDIKYFVYKICLSNEMINNVFAFDGYLENIGNGWKYGDVVYRITSVNILENGEGFVIQNNNYVFTLEIRKEYKNLNRTYTKEITIPTSSFASVINSKKNFVTNTSKTINSLLMSQDIKFFVEDARIQSVDKINNSNDLNIKTVSGSLATSFRKISDPNNQIKYSSNNSEFEYLLGDRVSFSTPINENGTKLVISSEQAYSFNQSGEFNTSSPLFTFLKSQQAAGHLTYLPELSKEEAGTATNKVDRQIQKLIFDPENTTYIVKNGKKVPPANYQAVVTKVELGRDAYTYLVAWSNIFTVSNSIVDNASELELSVKPRPNGTQLTWEELQQPANFSYISTIQKPQNNLIYNVKEVSFDVNDTYKTNAIVKVEISSEALGPQVTKIYETRISTGFKSKAYVSLEDQINQKLSSASDLSPLTPNVTNKPGVTNQDLLNNVYNLKVLGESLNVQPPQGLDQALYTITNARLDDGNKITIWFKISSINDPKRYWTYNSSVAQEVLVVIDLVLGSS